MSCVTRSFVCIILSAVFYETMAKIPFPHEMKNVTVEEDKLAKKFYKGYVRPFLRVGAPGYFNMAGYGDHAEDIYNLEVRPDDLWVTAFSRSGTTWTQELVWLIANDLNFEGAVNSPIFKRYNFIEYPTQVSEVGNQPQEDKKTGSRATFHDFRDIHTLPSPRFIKSHLPLSFLPPNLLDTAKVFYVARDPRDVAVSFYFMHKLFRYFDQDVEFADYWQLFKKNLVLHTPIFPHIEEAWQKRNHPNLMFLFYEDMQKDLPGVIDKICKFLSKEYTQEQKSKLAEFVSFEKMSTRNRTKTTSSENKFYRKGQSGKWVEYFNTEELFNEANEYMETHLKKTDLRFPTVS